MTDTLEHVLRKFAVKLGPRQKMPADIYTATRDDLAELFHELGFVSGVEIGVERGLYSDVLLRSNPQLRLHAVDAWKAHRGYRDHTSQVKLRGFHEETKKRLAGYGRRARIVQGFSLDVAQRFKLESLDFCYIDANHTFDYVMRDIIEWSQRVRHGGIVAGHDFMRRPPRGYEKWNVIKATTAYAEAHNINPWFTIGGGSRDEIRSWFWVKP
jgi:SAM-dependent methyltransferase